MPDLIRKSKFKLFIYILFTLLYLSAIIYTHVLEAYMLEMELIESRAYYAIKLTMWNVYMNLLYFLIRIYCPWVTLQKEQKNRRPTSISFHQHQQNQHPVLINSISTVSMTPTNPKKIRTTSNSTYKSHQSTTENTNSKMNRKSSSISMVSKLSEITEIMTKQTVRGKFTHWTTVIFLGLVGPISIAVSLYFWSLKLFVGTDSMSNQEIVRLYDENKINRHLTHTTQIFSVSIEFYILSQWDHIGSKIDLRILSAKNPLFYSVLFCLIYSTALAAFYYFFEFWAYNFLYNLWDSFFKWKFIAFILMTVLFVCSLTWCMSEYYNKFSYTGDVFKEVSSDKRQNNSTRYRKRSLGVSMDIEEIDEIEDL